MGYDWVEYETWQYHGHESLICETILLTWLTHCAAFRWRVVGYDWMIMRLDNTMDMTHSYVRHDSFLCWTWLILMWDMIYSHVWYARFIRPTYEEIMSHIVPHMNKRSIYVWNIRRDVPHMNKSCLTWRPTYEEIMSHMTSHIWINLVSHTLDSSVEYKTW